jgi:gliding motility-associated-like protein
MTHAPLKFVALWRMHLRSLMVTHLSMSSLGLSVNRVRCTGLVCLLLIALTLKPQTGLQAQTIDESTPKDTSWTGVGADSTDFVAQSFFANISRVRKFGVWLKPAAGTGEVKLALMRDNGTGSPDMNFILEESVVQMPDSNGGWVWDSTFSAVLVTGTKYWVVVDGYNNLQGTGYSTVGTSGTFTDTGEALFRSLDGGATWAAFGTQPLAVHVEGDNCTFPLTVTPQQPMLCPGTPIEVSVPSGFVSYAWSDGQTAASVFLNNVGLYSVTAVDANNCISTAAVLVVAGVQPISNLFDYYEGCQGTPMELVLPPFYAQYDWSTGATTSRDTIEDSGTYWVDMVSTTGCFGTDTFEVFMRPLPNPFVGAGDSLCTGDSVRIDAGAFNSYTWSTAEFTREIVLTQTTTVWVEVADSFGCSVISDTVVYGFYPYPADPVLQELPTGLHSSFSNYYAWTFNGQVIPGEVGQDLANPEPGTYTVIVTNSYGCSVESDSLVVAGDTEEGDFVTEAFSPNGDGINDFFYVEGIVRYPELSLVVFDRFGGEVFRRERYNNDWFGTGKSGEILPMGDYFYVLDFGTDRESLHGNVLIGR